MNRRELMAGLSATGAALFGATQSKAAAASAMTADQPFLCPITGRPDMMALCYPKSQIDHAYCYMLDDHTTIFAEGTRWCDGKPEGWRVIAPGQFDGRVIGRVISVYLRQGDGWRQTGSGYLAG